MSGAEMEEDQLTSVLRVTCSSCDYRGYFPSTIGLPMRHRRCGCGGVLDMIWGTMKCTFTPEPNGRYPLPVADSA